MLAVLLCAVLFAQTQQDSSKPAAPAQAESDVIKTTVNVVTAPVTVLDRDGNFVDNLQPAQFRLFDNEKEQDIKVDVTFQPISMVIAVQANDRVEAVLPQIQKIGGMEALDAPYLDVSYRQMVWKRGGWLSGCARISAGRGFRIF